LFVSLCLRGYFMWFIRVGRMNGVAIYLPRV
jgi:hypothetical protein